MAGEEKENDDEGEGEGPEQWFSIIRCSSSNEL